MNERKIKFRIRLSDRRIKSELTIYSALFGASDSLMEFPVDMKQWNVLSIDEFTGLMDKNAREIYENDLIKSHDSETVGIIKYINCSFMIEWQADCYSDLLGWYNYKRGAPSKPQDFEIVGNIHESKK